MADLPTNFLDDILSASMGGKRRYKITRLDGSSEEVTIEDISEYDQYGSKFGAGDINKINQAVNEKFDSGDVVDPMLTTEEGFAADAYKTKLQFDDIGEVVLLAETGAASTKNVTDVDISTYRKVMVVGYKFSSNINIFVGSELLPTNLFVGNSRMIARYIAGGTQNVFTVTRTGDKAFTLQAEGADNYGTRFYGIK